MNVLLISRMKRGTCAGRLTLQSVETSGHRYLHTFKRENAYGKFHLMVFINFNLTNIINLGIYPIVNFCWMYGWISLKFVKNMEHSLDKHMAT